MTDFYENAHFFASSIRTWATTSEDRSLSDLIKLMDKEKLTYNLWLVPCPSTQAYAIEWFSPQIEGAKLIETVDFSKGRKVKTGESK
jgi:hypothetical protein